MTRGTVLVVQSSTVPQEPSPWSTENPESPLIYRKVVIMKFLTKLFTVLAALIALLILLILFFSTQPDFSKRLGDTLFGNDGIETTQSAVVDAVNSGSSSLETNNIAPSESELGLVINLPEEEQYVDPGEVELVQPEAVAGRTGYIPVVETAQEVAEEESAALIEALDYGETGEDLSFDTLFYPYYGMLDSSLQSLYKQIYANGMALNKSFAPIVEVSINQVNTAFMAVVNDHPELFWMDTAYACKYLAGGKCIEIELQFNQTIDNLDENKQQFEKYAAIMIKGARNMTSAYEKEVYVHDMLISQVAYKLDAPMNQSAYSAIVTGQTVCAGYARAFQYLMQQLGVPCYYCTGYAGENHAWNIIKLEDGFYNVDSTWNDTDPNTYDYFNKSDAVFNQNHRRTELSIYLPACLGEQYQNLENTESTDTAIVEESQDEVVTEIVDEGRTLEEVGFSQEDVLESLDAYYLDAYNQVIENGVGVFTFQNVIREDQVYEELLNVIENNTYNEGYVYDVHEELGTNLLAYLIYQERLQDGYILLTHEITLQ